MSKQLCAAQSIIGVRVEVDVLRSFFEEEEKKFKCGQFMELLSFMWNRRNSQF